MEQFIVIIPEKFPVPSLVLIADRGFGRSPLYSQMVQVTGGRAEPVADITDGLALGKLAEKHRDHMGPAIKSFGMLVRLLFPDHFIERRTIKFFNYL